MPKKWIQAADIKKGALRDYIRRRFGAAGFTERGTIKNSILHDLIRDKHVTMRTRRRAQLALNLRGLRMSKTRRRKR